MNRPTERPFRVGVSGSYGGLNLGDEAILKAVMQRLAQSLPVEITVFTRDVEDTRQRHPRAARVVLAREMRAARLCRPGNLRLIRFCSATLPSPVMQFTCPPLGGGGTQARATGDGSVMNRQLAPATPFRAAGEGLTPSD